MGGTLATACPQCGSFGPCAHSYGYVPAAEYAALQRQLELAKQESASWKALSVPKPKPKPKEGVWCAFYPKSATAYVFKSELDALRFARDFDKEMIVKFIEYGSHVE